MKSSAYDPEQLYSRLYPMLFEYARSSLDSDSLAREAVQDTFAIAFQKPRALYRSPDPLGYLVNILKRVLMNTLHAQDDARRILLDYFSSNINHVSLSSECISLEIDGMDGLEEFKLLKEYALDGKSYWEMAQARGISTAACRKQAEQAMEFLRKKTQ